MTEITIAPAFNNPLLERLPPREILIARDTFTRGDTAYPPVANGLGKTEVGEFPWINYASASAGSAQYGGLISANQVGVVVKGNSSGQRYGSLFDHGAVGDVRYRVRFKGGAKDTSVQIPLRGVDFLNCYFLTVQSTKWMLYTRVNNQGEKLIEPIGIGYAGNDDLLDVLFVGTNIKLSLNGTVIGETTSSLFQNGTKFGFAQQLTSAEVDLSVPKAFFDNFEVYKYVNWA